MRTNTIFSTKAIALALLLMLAPLTMTPAGAETFESTQEFIESFTPTSEPLFTTHKTKNPLDGNNFCVWFWEMVECIGDNDKFDVKVLKEKNYEYGYPEVSDNYKLAVSIVASMDKNGDKLIDFKEFADESIDIIKKRGVDYTFKEEQYMRNNVIKPLFKGLDYIGPVDDRFNEKMTLDANEIAGNLYALSKKNLKTGSFTGANVAEEFINIMYEGHPTGQFEINRNGYK